MVHRVHSNQTPRLDRIMDNDLELRWANKDLELHPTREQGYKWVPPSDPRATEPLTVRHAGSLGHGVKRGTVVIADAFHALRTFNSLIDFGATEKIRLVYIDPPYNTGQAFAQYADSLTHAAWLSMLRDRLEAVKPHLAPLASVWLHLDDAEQHRARCVLDEVFGCDAFVATVVWQKRTTRESRSAFSSNHDYIHVYAPAGPQQWKRSRNLLPQDPSALRNRDGDQRGPWADAPFTAPGFRANQQYAIVNPAGNVLTPPRGRSWYATKPTYEKLKAENRIWFPRNGAGLPRMKLFPDQLRGLVPFSLWGADDGATNDEAKRHLMSMFPDTEIFATPKPEQLLERIIHIGSDPGDLIVDFFAGSGTTAAVAHKMGRRWVVIERSFATVQDFLIPRLARVASGDEHGGITELVGWRGGGSFDVAEVAPAGARHRDAMWLQAHRTGTTFFHPLSSLGSQDAARPARSSNEVLPIFDVEDPPQSNVA